MTTEELKAWAELAVENKLRSWVTADPNMVTVGTAILALIAEKEEIEAERERWAKWAVAAAEAEPLRARVRELEGALQRLLDVGLCAGEGVAEARAALAGEILSDGSPDASLRYCPNCHGQRIGLKGTAMHSGPVCTCALAGEGKP